VRVTIGNLVALAIMMRQFLHPNSESEQLQSHGDMKPDPRHTSESTLSKRMLIPFHLASIKILHGQGKQNQQCDTDEFKQLVNPIQGLRMTARVPETASLRRGIALGSDDRAQSPIISLWRRRQPHCRKRTMTSRSSSRCNPFCLTAARARAS
jgi:hypothetical protein